MIVVDTNVLSEIIRSAPDPSVQNWWKRQAREATFATAASLSEMLAGVRVLPEGRRRDSLSALVAALFDTQFEGRLLSFDAPAAECYGEIVAMRRRAGRPIGIMDAQIAAIALSRGAAVATRDVADFEEIGLDLIDPWNA